MPKSRRKKEAISNKTFFDFGTKSSTLKNLESLVTCSIIPPFTFFTVRDWRLDKSRILSSVSDLLGGSLLIVRSSTLNEDTTDSSMAGAFLSVPNIASGDFIALETAIEQVISSYSGSENIQNGNHQILVQEMVVDVSMSGVIFTHDMNTGAPYYVVNYDDESGRTDTISSGTGYINRTLLVHRQSWSKLESNRFLRLIKSTREIEKLTKTKGLDIEFILDTSHRVHIVQVRPITTDNNWDSDIGPLVDSTLERLASELPKRLQCQTGVSGTRSIFGKMPDWNPAEMIGTSPRPLAFSLYHVLITEQAWRIARQKMGYAHPAGKSLMVSFAGQPFIDVRLSFHSFLPEKLPHEIGTKIVDAWLDRLEKHPHLHDKVEFDVALTAYTFDFNQRAHGVLKELLTNEELTEFKIALRELTLQLVGGHRESIQENLHLIEELNSRRKALINDKSTTGLDLVQALIDDCITYGTIPFSILARHGFIAKLLLNSLVTCGIFSKDEADLFQRSIPTVAGQFLTDLDQFADGAISREAFMERYGHLRPGSYDILSQRYDQRLDFLLGDLRIEQHSDDNNFRLDNSQLLKISRLLKDLEFGVTAQGLILYIERAIKSREYAKFIFTRSLSDIIEKLANWGESIGFTRNDLSFLSLKEIFEYRNATDKNLAIERIYLAIERGSSIHRVNESVHLPHLISRPSDFFVIPLLVEEPNFITRKVVQAECVEIKHLVNRPIQLSGKIVAIESADPGFDWIFAQRIAGLITKFGGANSHMAIRCAEFGLPAAIGCGEQIYSKLVNSGAIIIHCAERRVYTLRN